MTSELARHGARPVGPVVRSHDFTIWARAEAVLLEARRRAQTIEEDARGQAEIQRGQAIEEGRLAGAADVAAAVAAASARAERFVASLEAELPRIVMDVVRSILGTFDRETLVVDSVRAALQDYRQAGKLVLQAHPDDADAIRRILAESPRADEEGGPGLELDPGSTPGRVLLTGEFGAVDLSLDAQLRALEDGLRAGWVR